MKKVLFLIHDLDVGGAEKVLVNLVNHMDREQFDITVVSLFGGGVNEQFLLPHIHHRAVWDKAVRGNSHYMKLLTPEQLHRICVKEKYDVEIAYLEGPSSRIVSGCPYDDTRLISWVHVEQHSRSKAVRSYRSYRELLKCYSKFDQIVCVSEAVKNDFFSICPQFGNVQVLYNTIETDKISEMKDEPVDDIVFHADEIKLVAVGKINKTKGFDRLARIVKRLRDEQLPVHLYALGSDGGEQAAIEKYLKEHNLEDAYTFLGYKVNPYKYVARCDVFVCASWSEGFSTAATEALISGTPVCTTDVSGMREMLGENNEWGVVTHNDDESLYEGIKGLINNQELLEYYRVKAIERAAFFSTDTRVKAAEALISDKQV